MIEVEKKFILSEEDIARLISGAEFISEKSFTDTYFDTQDYSLTTQDIWFRQRGNSFELKLPLNQGKSKDERLFDQYEEVTDEEEIKSILGIKEGKLSVELLRQNGYLSFANFTTTRKKYKRKQFIIDLDQLDFGFQIGEIELMVDEDQRESAIQQIIEFAKENGLKIAPVRGKVTEYISRNNPAHLQKLIEAGVILELS